jgi:hypothetical protein
MSIFRTMTVGCPACEETFEVSAVESLNADRRPDLSAAVVDGSFQVQTCPKCEKKFRLDPILNYLDVAHSQWISVQPLTSLGNWIEEEDDALDVFSKAYGTESPPAAQEIGNTLRPRLVFGWAALREKIVAAENKLDDVTLEMLKLALLDGLEKPPLAAGNELRLEGVDGDEIELHWVKAETEHVVEALRVPRKLYDDIAADTEGWAEVRKLLQSGPFIDMQKLYMGAGRPVAA